LSKFRAGVIGIFLAGMLLAVLSGCGPDSSAHPENSEPEAAAVLDGATGKDGNEAEGNGTAENGETGNETKAGGSAETGKPADLTDDAAGGGKEETVRNAGTPGSSGKTAEIAGPLPKEMTQDKHTGAAAPTDRPAPASGPGQTAPQTQSQKPQQEPPQEHKDSAEAEQVVTIAITGPEDVGEILAPETVPVEEGDTVLDVLRKVTRQKKIHMEYSGRSSSAYVEGIANLYEFDRGAGSGWLYSVNGKFQDRSAGAVTVSPGDEIRFVYTLDFGKDVGAAAGIDEGEKP